MNVRVQVSGTGTTQVTASVWVAGTAEPTTPMLVRTDATAELQVPGAAGINVHRPASATATNVVRFTGFTVTTMTAAPVGPPPAANVAPTAAFTASPAGLAVSLDAAGSADSDGTVASYAWNFGDGATGEGETASHTYGFSGTYPVTLTVTDDDGATATTATDVTVLAPPVLEVVASDTFNRTVTGGLGTADTGGDWTVVAGGTRQSVTPGVAELRLDAAGNNTGSYLAGVSRTDADVRTTFSLTELPTGNGTYVYVTGRRVGTGQEYRARVRVLADGRIALAVSRLAGGTEAFPGGEIVLPGLTYAAGTAVNVRVKVFGTGTTQVEATVWLAGFAEPATPSITRTDTTAELQVAGGVGLAAHRPSGTTAATAVRFAAFTVTPAV
jgi:PKD repeat protein